MVLRPVGPLPPQVYWVRRVLLSLLALGILAGAWWLLDGNGDATSASGQPASASPAPSESRSPSPSPSPSGSISESKSPKPKATETKKANADLAPPCGRRDIEVTVTASATRYAKGREPSFTLAVGNVSDETCSRDVGQAALELQVTSGGEQVWSSDDCSPGGEDDPQNLEPGDRYVQTVSWDRLTSTPGCTTSGEPASSGEYQVVARNLDLLSEPATFTLA